MAYTAINVAIAKVVADAKQKVVDDLLAFMSTKVEVDEDILGMFKEFKDSLKEEAVEEAKVVKKGGKKGKKSDSDGEVKKKRAPTVFNLFVKAVMSEIKAANPDIKDGKKFISMASEQWKTSERATFVKDKVAELKKEDKDADIHDLFAKAMAMYSGDSDVEVEKPKNEEKPKAKKGGKKATKSDDEEKPKAKKGGKKVVKTPSPVVDSDDEPAVESEEDE